MSDIFINFKFKIGEIVKVGKILKCEIESRRYIERCSHPYIEIVYGVKMGVFVIAYREKELNKIGDE